MRSVTAICAIALLFLIGCGSDHDAVPSTPTATAIPTVVPTATASPSPHPTSPPMATATQTQTAIDTATPEPTATVVLTIHDEFLPSADDMMGWIATVVAQGIRRPGYPADVWAEQWIRDQFAAFGLQDPTLDPVPVKRWQLQQCALMVWADAAPQDVRSIPCFAVPYSAAALGLKKSVALLTTDADVTDRIAVVEHQFLTLPQTIIRAFSTREYDPDGEFDTISQTLPFAAAFQNVMEPAITAGAAGFIGIVGAPFDTHDYFVPYDAVERPIPGVWISASDGAALKDLLAAGAVSGRIVVDSMLDDFTSHNVIATLPGNSDEWIIIGSHHDGPWASAVEDASGISMVLAQARYWSQVPQRERPHNMMFVLQAGHMSGGAGLIATVTRNAERLNEVVLELHLEHAARETRPENGVLIPTDKPEVRWWFTSRIGFLEDAVEQALRAEDLRRSFIMPPDGFPPGSPAPPTDGAFFHPAGVPIVNFLTAPMYLFAAQDTLDKIHTPSLVPITRAGIRIINSLQGRTAAEMRAAVRPPPMPG